MTEDYTLKHRPFVILGLISEKMHEGGCHAYDINKRIEDRGMRNWTNIGLDFSFSTIYRTLDRLEKDELVDSFEEEIDNRSRKTYRITDLGYNILRKKVYNVLNNYMGRNDEDFYVAFSMFPILNLEEQAEAVANSIKRIKKHKKELNGMLDESLAEFPKMPINVTGLFIHPIKVLQADIEFLELVLEEIKKGGGNVEPEEYNK
ncbi:MAG: PadR family transcriptional regulator [Candidatus Lokiarchaeota archaeon]|nr:PadR family transcriptional regulator [Candidatus Lokiarchaeota archaeon]